MNYKNCANILPQKVLREVQKYVQGELIYVPTSKLERAQWGQKSGAREFLVSRNNDIFNKFKQGIKIDQLSQEYFLSEDCIRKIIYKQVKEAKIQTS